MLAGGIAAAVVETVSATATQDATFVAAIIGTVAEIASATATQDAVAILAGAVAEAAAAASAQDATAITAAAVAIYETAHVSSTTPSTLLGTEMPDSGPVTVFQP